MTGSMPSRRRGHSAMSEINVTPFVDVMLVLLVVFMVTAPVLLQEMTVQLPRSTVGQASVGEGVVVTVASANEIYIGKERVSWGNFPARFAAARTRIGSRPVFLKADEKVPYGKVVEVVGAIRAAGIEQVGLVVEPAPKVSKQQ